MYIIMTKKVTIDMSEPIETVTTESESISIVINGNFNQTNLLYDSQDANILNN
jgi:hypothetical protein